MNSCIIVGYGKSAIDRKIRKLLRAIMLRIASAIGFHLSGKI
ncbi:hypothetical protein [Microcoleus sp. CAWBG58]|nr:hypothetical protein [Microcoleus sp. CAWBG58]